MNKSKESQLSPEVYYLRTKILLQFSEECDHKLRIIRLIAVVDNHRIVDYFTLLNHTGHHEAWFFVSSNLASHLVCFWGLIYHKFKRVIGVASWVRYQGSVSHRERIFRYWETLDQIRCFLLSIPNLLQFSLCSQTHIFSLCSLYQFLIGNLAVNGSYFSKFENIIWAFSSPTTLWFVLELIKVPM